MTDTTAQTSAPVVAPANVAATPASLPRRLTLAAVVANGVTAGVSAIGVGAAGHTNYWPALTAALVVAAVGLIASVSILSKAAGLSIEWLVTFVMGASAVRVGVSLLGLMVAVLAFKTPAGPTAFFVCTFYVVTLVVESAVLSRTLRRLAVVGGTDAV